MKIYVKKLLSILTALTLLVSLVLPAGVIPAFAETETLPDVTEFTFADGNRWCEAVYTSSGDAGKEYLVKFDYYLAAGQTLTFSSVAGNIGVKNSTNTTLEPGMHTFYWRGTTSNSNNTFAPFLKASGAATLYVWNYSVTLDGSSEGFNRGHGDDYTEATVADGQALDQYSWYRDVEIEDEVVAYVDQARTNTESALMDANAPFGTISAAIYALNAYEGQNVNRVIKVIGTYRITSAESKLPAHSEMMSIVGASAESHLQINNTMQTIGGPLTIDDIGFAGYNGDNGVIMDGYEMVFGDGVNSVTSVDHHPQSSSVFNAAGVEWFFGGYGKKPLGNDFKLTLNNGTLKQVSVHSMNYSNTIAGGTVTVNGGVITTLSVGGSSNFTSTYTDDVNIVINGGSVPTIRTRGYWAFADGKALQIVLNNGVSVGKLPTSVPSSNSADGASADDVLYIIKVDAYNGVTLTTTDVAGVYTVNGDIGKYVPVVYDANGAKVEGAYDANAKTITVAAGTYNVKFERLDPIVTHITAPAGVAEGGTYRWTPGSSNFYKGGIDEATAYIISFDYYLPEAVSTLSFDSVSGWMTTTISSNAMNKNKGHHTFTWTTYANPEKLSTGQFVPYIKMAAGTEMYMWNWSVKQNGAELAPSNGGYNASGNADMTYGTKDQYLYDYEWYATMDDSVPVSMEILSNPTKTEYEIGESLNTAGLSLSVTDNYGETYTVTEGFEVSGFDSATAGERTVTVNYKGAKVTFTVTVKAALAATGIAVGSMPKRVVYPIDAAFEEAGLTINLVYNNGTTEAVTGYELSGFSSATTGEKTIMVTYGDFTTTFTVTVIDPVVTEIVFPEDTDGASTYSLAKPFYFGGVDEATAYTLSFDYYLPNSIGGMRVYSVSQGMTPGAPSVDLNAGIHHYEWTAYSSKSKGQFVPAIESLCGVQMYIWNWRVTINGEEITSSQNGWNAQTNGTVGDVLSSYDWYKYKDDPDVTEYDFSTGSKWCLGFYAGVEATAETPYIMSFDYYLAPGSGSISVDSIGVHSSITKGSMTFKPGHHTIYAEWKTNNANKYHVPQLVCKDTNTKLYIWNYSVTVGGAAGRDNGSIDSAWRTATKRNVGKLGAQSWYATMDDSIPVSLEITSNPTKTEYKFGETLDLDGLVLSVIDNYDVASVVTEGYEVSGFDSMMSGTKTITVSYNGMTATFTVTVKVPTVTEIDFSTGNAWTENIYKKAAMSVENPYVVTFEYFLPSNATVIFDSVAGSIGTQAGSSSSVLQIGHHTFKGIYAVTAGQNCIAPRLKCSDTSVKLYIWNYSITLGGEAITKDDSGAGFTTATVTAGNELPAYDWYEHMDSPITTEITFPENGTSKNSSWSPMPAWYFYSGSSADTPYVVSFDYYLPKTIGGIRMYCVSGNTTTVSGGTMSRYEGHHHAEWVVYSTMSSGQFVYAIEAPVGSEMYIWNFSVTVDGVEVAPTDKSAEWNGQTNGTTGTFLTAYDWYATMDEVIPQYIAVATAPDKKEYEIGEQLITDGLTLEYVTNYSTTTITEGFEVSGFDSTTSGKKTVTVTYGGLSASFDVTIKTPAVTSLELASAPSKTVYEYGESLDTAGLVLKPTYSDGSTATVTDGFEVSGYNAMQSGKQTVTVTYGGYTVTFDVTVNEPKPVSIAVGKMPKKTAYTLDEEFDATGIVINLVYNSGATEAVSGYELSGFESSTLGEKTITVTYGDFVTTFTVAVIDPVVTEIVFPEDTDGASTYSLANPFYFGGIDESTAYTLSFDYYLPKTVGGMRVYSVSQGMSTSAPSVDLKAGIHHYEWTAYSTATATGQFVPAIESLCGVQMYIWNWSVTINGEEITSSQKGWNAQTNGTAGNVLSSYDWYTFRNHPDVTEYDFSTGDGWCLGFYTGKEATAEVPYIMTFDYYLAPGSGEITYDSIGAHSSLTAGSMVFKPGHHTIYTEWKTNNTNNYHVPKLICKDTNTKLYIWNFSVTIGGANGNNNGSISASWRTATKTEVGKLGAQSWYPIMDDSIPMSLEITSNPTKTEYELGESLDLDGLALVMRDNYDRLSEVTEGYTVSGFDSAKGGAQTITVSYNGFTTTFTVVVVAPSGIAVATGPNKTNYELGDTLDVTGLTINLVYTNGKTEPVTNFTVGTLDSTRGGEKAITVTYGEFTTTFTVTVYEPIVTEISAPSSVTSGTYRWTPGDKNFYRGGVDASTAYTVTFDYFIPETVSTLTFASVSGFTSGYVSGSNAMKKYPGHHKFEWTFYIKDANFTTGQFVPYIKLGYGDTMYLWNWSVKQNGVELAPYNGNYNANHNADMTYGTSENGLTTYEWYSYMDDIEPPVPAYHFDFDGENFDRTSFVSGTNTVYKSLFYAENVVSGAASGTFTLTFDYYLPEATPIYVNCANRTDLHIPDDTTGSAYLHQGRHTFKATLDMADISSKANNSGSNTIFGFATIYDYWLDVNSDGVVDGAVNGTSILPGDLYVWNFSLKNEDTNEVRATGFTRGFAGAGKGCIADTAFDMNKLEMVNVSDVTLLDYTTAPEYGDEDFGTTGSYGIYYPAKMSLVTGMADVEYKISFDYYLPEANKKVDVSLSHYTNADGSSGLRNTAKGETSRYGLEVGRHKFEATFTSDQLSHNLISLGFIGNCGTNNTLMKVYVWNMSLVCTAGNATQMAQGNYFEGRDFHVYTTGEAGEIRKPTITKCDFTVEENEPTSELNMVGSQLRSDYALRFVSAVAGANIPRLSDGKADYSNATITIGGLTYKVTGAGILFGRDVRLMRLGGTPDSVMTLGNVGNNLYKIPATKLQSEQYHERYLGKGVQGVVFTGVITNLPRANWDESLSARSYVVYLDENGNECVFYGEVISRSLTNTKDAISGVPTVSVNAESEAAAQALKDSVLNAENTTFSAKTTYYVDSKNGNDANDGTSPETAWKTLTNVNALSQNRSSSETVAVYFKRGSVFRGTALKAKSYTSYGAYGVGPKPVFTGSAMNYLDEASLEAAGLEWVKLDGFENRWQLKGIGDYLEPGNSVNENWGNHIANVYFITVDDEGNESVISSTKSASSAIYGDYVFYQSITRTYTDETETAIDTANIQLGDLFISLPYGVEPTDFDRIEIPSSGTMIRDELTSGYTLNTRNDHFFGCNIDNLAIKYVGSHGIGFNSTVDTKPINNVNITNCEIGWIGGAIQGNVMERQVRLGNGIELYGAVNTGKDTSLSGTPSTTITNNWIYQCYDAGYSNQGGYNIASNINVTENLIEYCAYSIEIWMEHDTGLIRNCHYDNNVMRFAGYQFESFNRSVGSGSQDAISHVNFMYNTRPCENVTVNNNIFDTSVVSLVCVTYPNSTESNTANDGEGSAYRNDVTGPEIKGNTYIQGYDKQTSLAKCAKRASNESSWDFYTIHGSATQAEMEASVAAIGDTTAKDVIFYNQMITKG